MWIFFNLIYIIGSDVLGYIVNKDISNFKKSIKQLGNRHFYTTHQAVTIPDTNGAEKNFASQNNWDSNNYGFSIQRSYKISFMNLAIIYPSMKMGIKRLCF